MKRSAWIVMVAIALSLSEVLPSERKDEAYLIRRAYLDILGVVPTISELEWYCEHNNDGYNKAVDYLLGSSAMRLVGDAEVARKRAFLMSSNYKQGAKVLLPNGKLDEIIKYLVNYSGDTAKAKELFINYARAYEDGDLDAIDRMALQLMGRVTTVDEANRLLRVLRCGAEILGEMESWRNVLEQLLIFDDVRNK
jgi:hypothetical protein